MDIIKTNQVGPISRINCDYKENGEAKSLSCKSKALISCTQWGEHDYSSNNKKNRDYYESPNFSYFTDKLWL